MIITKQLTAQEMVDQEIDKYIYINPKILKVFGLIGLVMIIGVVSFSIHKVLADKPIEPITCRNFKYQEDAQKFYWENRAFYLDGPDQNGKRNGIACEYLPHKPQE